MLSGLVGTIYTQSNSDFMENPYFEKLADFSCVMWICGFAPRGPSALLATKKGLIRNKDMPFGNPPHHGTKNCGLLKNIDFLFFAFHGSKSGVLGQKTGGFECFGPGAR